MTFSNTDKRHCVDITTVAEYTVTLGFYTKKEAIRYINKCKIMDIQLEQTMVYHYWKDDTFRDGVSALKSDPSRVLATRVIRPLIYDNAGHAPDLLKSPERQQELQSDA